jgi:hypothetical protein
MMSHLTDMEVIVNLQDRGVRRLSHLHERSIPAQTQQV